MEFIKNHKEEVGEGFVRGIYTFIPVSPCNLLSITYQEATITEKKEGEEWVKLEEPVIHKAMVIEMPFLSEYSESVPLKVSRKVKQTKTEEFFFHEEPVKVMRPTIYKIEDDNIESILNWVNLNLIN